MEDGETENPSKGSGFCWWIRGKKRRKLWICWIDLWRPDRSPVAGLGTILQVAREDLATRDSCAQIAED